MSSSVSQITVLFEDPFWVCLYERTSKGRYEVCKITFGAEPKDYEVYDFLLKNWNHLRFSPSVSAIETESRRINPKRMQRIINKKIESTGIGTKAQQALKLQQEEGKLARKKKSREQKELEKQFQYKLHLDKKREKHKGH